MKTLITAPIAVSLAQTVLAETHDVGSGTFKASGDFVFKHTGTKDSFMGTLTRKSDGFTIIFDVGLMAGVHMSDSRKDKLVRRLIRPASPDTSEGARRVEV